MTMFARNRMTMICRRAAMLAAPAAVLVSLGGCATGGESQSTSSGDPEADRRADMRVGSDEGKGGKGGGEKGTRTLYERLGGAQVIVAVVDDMTPRILEDPRVNFQRRDVKTNWFGKRYKAWQANQDQVTQFKEHMVEFLVLAAGGPVDYTGRDMREVHQGMRISNNEFDAMVGDMKVSMDRVGIGAREKRELLAVIETTRKQIVEK